MRKRIFAALFLMGATMLVACFAVVVLVLYGSAARLQEERLDALLASAASALARDGGPIMPETQSPSLRFTHVAADGTVLHDSRGTPATMDDHAARSEIRDALASGIGRSVRYSATLAEETAYIARRLPDGTILRISESRATAFRMALDAVGWLLVGGLCLLAASAVAAQRLARNIVAPLNTLDLEHPLGNDVYAELAPMLERLELQRLQIAGQLDTLQKQADEFRHIISAMEEGLVVLDASRKILGINPAACRIFGTEASCIGSFFLSLHTPDAILDAVQSAMHSGKATHQLERGGRTYHIDISRLESGGEMLGTVLLACDITAIVEEQRRRREFTANVSHELKTPLQSVIGAAELLKGGMVRPEDTAAFVARIHAEGVRMAATIQDIMLLSRLEEEGEIPVTTLDLAPLALESVERFRQAAARNDLDLRAECHAATITGSRGILAELVDNLVENAVKYNRPSGSVLVRTGVEDGRPFLSVADTGIGIAEEDRPRVFERFYRVDKSRSRQTGGTGLGLSIVKHAAAFHRAELGLSSTLGKGTEIRLVFPKTGAPFQA